MGRLPCSQGLHARIPKAVGLLGGLLAGLVLAQGPAASVVRNWAFTLQKDGRTAGRFKGGMATPVAGMRAFDVETFHVDTFRADGELDLTAESPSCRVYMTNDSFVVTSPGALKVVQADGRFELSGEGFHWDQGAQRLVVSNRVKTLLAIPLPGGDRGK